MKPAFSAERSVAVIKRCLHILALLQNDDGRNRWNDSSLAKVLSADEGKKITPAAVKKYRDYIETDLGLKFDRRQGAHQCRLKNQPDPELSKSLARLYIEYNVRDTTLDIIINFLAGRHEKDLLWILGCLYLSCKMKRKVRMKYLKDDAEDPKEYLLHPYYLVLRNTELYLLCRKDGFEDNGHIGKFGDVQTFIVDNIIGLELTDEEFDDPDVPAPEEYYEYSFGSYTDWEFCPELVIKVNKSIVRRFVKNFSNLNPKSEKIDDSFCRVTFRSRDVRSVFRQLIMYGKDVEVLGPDRVRKEMFEMLEESLGVYNK